MYHIATGEQMAVMLTKPLDETLCKTEKEDDGMVK
jgi:hypothetical protein